MVSGMSSTVGGRVGFSWIEDEPPGTMDEPGHGSHARAGLLLMGMSATTSVWLLWCAGRAAARQLGL